MIKKLHLASLKTGVTMFDLSTAGVAAIAAIVSALTDLYQFGEKILRNEVLRNQEANTILPVPSIEQQTKHYQKAV